MYFCLADPIWYSAEYAVHVRLSADRYKRAIDISNLLGLMADDCSGRARHRGGHCWTGLHGRYSNMVRAKYTCSSVLCFPSSCIELYVDTGRTAQVFDAAQALLGASSASVWAGLVSAVCCHGLRLVPGGFLDRGTSITAVCSFQLSDRLFGLRCPERSHSQ